jgi:hypothetical protein
MRVRSVWKLVRAMAAGCLSKWTISATWFAVRRTMAGGPGLTFPTLWVPHVSLLRHGFQPTPSAQRRVSSLHDPGSRPLPQSPGTKMLPGTPCRGDRIRGGPPEFSLMRKPTPLDKATPIRRTKTRPHPEPGHTKSSSSRPKSKPKVSTSNTLHTFDGGGGYLYQTPETRLTAPASSLHRCNTSDKECPTPEFPQE